MAHDVFISHSSRDKSIADAVCAALESHGVRCWIAPRDIVPGMAWGASIVDAIAAARVMVLVFSQHANDSLQIKRELDLAAGNNTIIVPMRMEDVMPSRELQYYISMPHWLDARTPPLERHLEQLAKTIAQILAAPPLQNPSHPGIPGVHPLTAPPVKERTGAPETRPAAPARAAATPSKHTKPARKPALWPIVLVLSLITCVPLGLVGTGIAIYFMLPPKPKPVVDPTALWLSEKSADGRFEVRVPVKFGPRETQPIPTPDGSVTLYGHAAEVNNKAYLVAYFDVPAGFTGNLDDFMPGAVQGGMLVNQKPVIHNGYPAREALVHKTIDGIDIEQRIRIMAVNKRLYELIITAPRGTITQNEIDAFFGSFKFDPP